jgi:hypothetical protein
MRRRGGGWPAGAFRCRSHAGLGPGGPGHRYCTVGFQFSRIVIVGSRVVDSAFERLPGHGAYADGMSVMREELHHLIDQLPEEQVAPVLALVRESLPMGEDGETLWPLPSFVGTLASGKGDVAACSQEILREEMGRDAR